RPPERCSTSSRERCCWRRMARSLRPTSSTKLSEPIATGSSSIGHPVPPFRAAPLPDLCTTRARCRHYVPSTAVTVGAAWRPSPGRRGALRSSPVPTTKRQRKRENQQIRREAVLAAQRRAKTRTRVTATIVVLALFGGLAAVLAATGKKDKSTKTSTATTVATPTTEKAVPAGATITGATPCPPTNAS